MAPKYLRDRAFECGVCADDKEKGAPLVLLAGDPVCQECFLSEIKPQFEAAIEKKDHEGVKWAKTKLSPHDLPDFSTAFKEKWTEWDREFSVPQEKRIYCRHLTANYCVQGYWNRKRLVDRIGLIAAKAMSLKHIAVSPEDYAKCRRKGRPTAECVKYLGPSVDKEGQKSFTCVHCGGKTCQRCGTLLKPAGPAEHDCDPSKLKVVLDIDRTLVRGVDYQICPNDVCRKIRNLDAGCNSLVCDCLTHYCYICGKRAHHDSDHWRQGGCPRWNQPETDGAHHDAEEEPLVIPQSYRDEVEKLSAEAEKEPTEQGRQMKTLEGLCVQLLGELIARRIRAEEQQQDDDAHVLWNVEWFEGTQDLVSAIHKGMGVFVARMKGLSSGRYEEVRRAEVDALNFEREREKVVKLATALRAEYPAVFDLLGQLEYVLDTHLTVSAKEIKELTFFGQIGSWAQDDGAQDDGSQDDRDFPGDPA